MSISFQDSDEWGDLGGLIERIDYPRVDVVWVPPISPSARLSRRRRASLEADVRVLIVGANGFIGSPVLARLRRAGHDVVAVVRAADAAARVGSEAHARVLDMARADPDTWQAHLAGVDALVNCAGVLQDSPRDSTKVHASGAAALFAACERAGFRRVIHFSAIGVDRVAPTDFSRSKLKGDQDLMARDLDWVILCVPLSWSVPPPSRPRRSGSVVAEDVRDLQSCAGRAGGASCRLCVPETQIPAPFSP